MPQGHRKAKVNLKDAEAYSALKGRMRTLVAERGIKKFIKDGRDRDCRLSYFSVTLLICTLVYSNRSDEDRASIDSWIENASVLRAKNGGSIRGITLPPVPALSLGTLVPLLKVHGTNRWEHLLRMVYLAVTEFGPFAESPDVDLPEDPTEDPPTESPAARSTQRGETPSMEPGPEPEPEEDF